MPATTDAYSEAIAEAGRHCRAAADECMAAGRLAAAVDLYRRALTIDVTPGPEYKPLRKGLAQLGHGAAAAQVVRWSFATAGRPLPDAEPRLAAGAVEPAAAPATAAADAETHARAAPADTIPGALSPTIARLLLTAAGLLVAGCIAADQLLNLDGLAAIAAFLLVPVVLALLLEAALRGVFLARSGFAGWVEGMLSDVQVHIDDLGAITGGQQSVATFAQGRYLMHPFVSCVRPPTIPGINGQGMFGPAYPDSSGNGTFRVLLLGGSVAERFWFAGTPEGDHYIAHHLQPHAKRAGYDAVAVYCGAIAGWNSVSFTQHALMHGDRFDCIVTLFGVNEYNHGAHKGGSQYAVGAKNFYLRFIDLHQKGYDRESTALRILIRQITARCARMARFGGIGTAIGLYVAASVLRDLQRRYAVAEEEDRSRPPDQAFQSIVASLLDARDGYRRSIRETAQNLDTLRNFCDRTGIALHCFLQPTAVTGKALTVAEQMRTGHQLPAFHGYPAFCDALQAAAPAGLQLDDLRDVFAGHADTVYSDFCHFTEDGCQSPGMDLLARRMAECIGPRLAGRAPASRPVAAAAGD